MKFPFFAILMQWSVVLTGISLPYVKTKRFRQSERGAQFDKRMDKALNADCFFCAPGEKGGRECEVGFDKPLPSEQTKCTRVSGEEWQRRFFYRVHGVHKTLP